MSERDRTPSIRRNRTKLVGIFLVAFAPLFGAYALYLYERGTSPWSTTNQGELLTPLRSADALRVVDRSGVSAPLKGRWWILVVTARTCDGECAAAAGRLRAVHVLLNQDQERVRRGILRKGGLGASEVGEGLDVGWERVTGEMTGLDDGIYVVDPLANLVLHYPFSAAGKPVLQDLKRLLSVSQIG